MPKFEIDKEFKGIEGVRAYHVALSIIRSLYYLPKEIDGQIIFHDTFEKMSNWFDELDEENKRKFLKIGVENGAVLEQEEIYSMLKFAKDENGVQFGKENINNLSPFAINDLILEVAFELAKQKVFFYQTNK